MACESHNSDPTMERSSVVSRLRSESEILLCGTESTGCPVLYGVGVGLASERPLLAMSCSENAD